jgi:inosose dehydratase
VRQQIEFGQMLDELVENGYTGTELGDWGYMPTDPARLRAELAKRNVVMIWCVRASLSKASARARAGCVRRSSDRVLAWRRRHGSEAFPRSC